MAGLLTQIQSGLADRYTFERELGQGGMATVYLATDLRHARHVAIKVLRPELAPFIGVERFLAEIRTMAALQHPHILGLIDSGDVGGIPYYVMPFIEGESLRDRLTREGALPLGDALRITREVGAAIDYAHRHGVIHRDIKPENILLSGDAPEGEVPPVDGCHALVADFGIALALSAAGGARLTQSGMSLGTPQYMSPEQAAGEQAIDARSDVYALGAVAYEMLTGTAPHTGPTAQAIIARLISQPPTPVTVLRAGVPPAVDGAIMRALAKSPADRFPTAAAFVRALDETRAPARRWSARHLVLLGVVTAAVAVAVALGIRGRTPAGSIRLGRVTHLTRDPALELDPALSPDGRTIAYAAGPPGAMRIYVRQIDGGRPIAIAEALPEHQRWPQWSPDGARIVFQVGHAERENDVRTRPNALYVVPALGGVPRPLVQDSTWSAITPAWSPDGSRIAFVRAAGVDGNAIQLIQADGGEPRTIVDSLDAPHELRWSPDGARLAYVTHNSRFALGTVHLGNDAPTAIWVIDVASGKQHPITAGTSIDVSPVWTDGGRALLFVSNRDGSRDVYRVRLSASGDPTGVPERITSGLNAHGLDLSRDGKTLAYSAFTAYSHIWSVPLPATGVASLANATQITTSDETIEGIALSSDGKWLAFDSDRSGNGDIWKISVDGGQPVQLTTDPTGDYVQDWSFDDREIAFHSFRTGKRQVFVMSADGTNVQRVTTTEEQVANPEFSPDALSIAFEIYIGVRDEILVSSRAKRGAPWGPPRQLTTHGGSDPSWSPDGRLIAYVRDGLWVMAPNGTGDRLVVPGRSGKAGIAPAFAYWSADSRTIYYKAYDEQERSSIWAVPVAGGTPRLLIRFNDPARPSNRREFATDGKRLYFTIAQPESDIWLMELESGR
jgi:serine/threonine-protein kinase